MTIVLNVDHHFMPYTVPKLTDFSTAALDGAVRELSSALEQDSAAVASENDWKAFRDRWIARKNGILTQLNDLWLKAAPKDTKRDVGQRVNEIKAKVEGVVEATLARVQAARRQIDSRPSVSMSPCPAFGARWARSIQSSRR
jgi:phenylalanyl-tRNA synthetase alpha chain